MNFIEIEYRERDAAWAMSDLQSHDYYELYFLLAGNRSFFSGNKMFSLSGPSLCVIPPFTMHKTAGGSYKRINVNVSAELLSRKEQEFLGSLAEGVAFSLHNEWAETVIALLAEASALSCIDAKEKQKLSLSFLHTILYLLSTKPLRPIERGASTATPAPDTLMLEVLSYLNTHYEEDLTLSRISERFYISKNTLSARFRASVDCSVMEYVAFMRLSRAKELLATTEKTVEEIAALCGYSSANYFSLSFKKAVGISPIKYKKTQ